jgi:nucleotide-binding universal stress UspA family protein
LARRFGAELTVLHVLGPLRLEFAMVRPTVERYHELIEARREQVEQELSQIGAPLEPGETVHRQVAEGDAASEIIERAHHGGFDLIVMSTRGSGPLRRWLLVGSVTSKVLYGADCPVMSSSCFESTLATSPGHIVCAVDLGPQSERALRYAGSAAREFGVPLTIVHAAAVPGGAADLIDEKVRAALHVRLSEKISAVAAKARVEADIAVEAGDPPQAIAAAARRLRAGLVVQGRGASTDLMGRLRASGYDIIRESPCPVVTV